MKALSTPLLLGVAILGATLATAQTPAVSAVGAEDSARPHSNLLGTWKLRVPDAMRNLQVGADLSFANDGTFQYVANGARKSTYRGKFELRAGDLNLERQRPSDPWPEGWAGVVRGSFDAAGRLVLAGLEFERSIEGTIAGTWLLQGERGTRLDLRKDGSFRFVSLGTRAESEGRWEVVGNHIELRYTAVDGEKVDYERRTPIEVSTDLAALTLGGRFRYVRG